MAAKLIHRSKNVYSDGAIVEMKLWEIPSPVPGSRHSLKYSLFYGVRGVRIVGYDNERGKGDHKHINGQEFAYTFVSVEQLVADFIADVRKIRGAQ